jgi:tetratricopeptide (TPR) repeat protein
MADVFVSYNRRDSDYAVLLHAWLSERFGRERVFWDRDDIDPGADFRKTLATELRECRALLALIGPGWKPSRWIRREIAAALGRKILVLPILVGGRSNLPGNQLPRAIRKLAWVQTLETQDLRFQERLMEHLAKAVPAAGKRAVASPGRRKLEAARLGELLYNQMLMLQTRAFALMDDGRPEQAAAELNDGLSLLMALLDLTPADETLLALLGYVYKDLANAFRMANDEPQYRRYANLAIATFRRVLETAKQRNDRAGALNGLGNAYAILGDYPQAIENSERAVALAPDYAYAWRDLVQFYDEQAAGRLDLVAMRRAVRQLKVHADGVPNLGKAEVRAAEARLRRWERRARPKRSRARGARRGRRGRG